MLHLFLSNLLAYLRCFSHNWQPIIHNYTTVFSKPVLQRQTPPPQSQCIKILTRLWVSAVVNIMSNKDKDIYLQESIEEGQYIMLSQPPEIQVKCLFHGQISPSGDFQKNIPSCSSFTSTLSFSPPWSHALTEELIISRTKYPALVIQNLDTIYWLTLFHSTPNLTWNIPDEDYWLFSIFPFMSKAFEFGMCNFLTKNNLLDLY